MAIFRFIFGLAIGSFLNVISTRYDPDKFLLANGVISGRSHCSHCKRKLRWFELLPLISFILQRGRCRTCNVTLSLQYPIAELAAGLILFYIPNAFYPCFAEANCFSSQVVWTLAFLALLLISLIDARLHIIPDELNLFILGLGIFSGAVEISNTSSSIGSLLGGYALLLGFPGVGWTTHLLGLVAGFLFFGFLIFITRGRGMGMGDLKLATALGLLFGWPDISLVIILAFIFGSIFGGYVMLRKAKTMRSFVPFGPFLALGALVTFLYGEEIMRSYFSLFPGW